jgi:hypothetical protein
MNKAELTNLLEPNFGAKLSKSLIDHYSKMNDAFQNNDLEKGLVKAGKFIEALFKCLHYLTTGEILTRIEVGKEITRLENISSALHSPSIRLLIPRVARTVYYIASDRGARHDVTDFEPEHMDAELARANCTYILCELIRIFSSGKISGKQAQHEVEELLTRKIPLLYTIDGNKRILNPRISIKDQIFLLLYNCQKFTASDEDLLKWTEYSNASYLKTKLLPKLHSERFIEYRAGIATLIPPGISLAEKLISENTKN